MSTVVWSPLNVGAVPDAERHADEEAQFDSQAVVVENTSVSKRWLTRAARYLRYAYGVVDRNFFLIFVLFSILLARAAPFIGRNGGPLAPTITTGYIATIIIFIISGVTMNTSQFVAAITNVKLNAFVLAYNMCFITLSLWAVSAILRTSSFSPELLDGLVILGALPTSISMCVILTTSASGDAAAALFNATTLNLVGIFLSPLWLVGLLSVHSSISLEEVVLKLVIKVVIPLIFGQMLRYIPHSGMQKELQRRKKLLKRVQDICLCLIVYTTFCSTFSEGTAASWADLISTFFLVLFLLISFMCLAWFILSLKVLGLTKPQRVAGLYTCTHKTVALGIPLISAVYEGSDDVGLYSIPLLMYHPLQLILGSFLVPKLKEFVESDENVTVPASSSNAGTRLNSQLKYVISRSEERSELNTA